MKQVPEDTVVIFCGSRGAEGHCGFPDFRAATYSLEIEYFDKIVPERQLVTV